VVRSVLVPQGAARVLRLVILEPGVSAVGVVGRLEKGRKEVKPSTVSESGAVRRSFLGCTYARGV